MKPFKKLPHQHQMIQHACALLLGTTLFSQIALAQSNLENIVVSGSRFEENIDRVPANIQVITKEQIQQSTSTNLAEVLQQIGNVQMVNQSGSLLGVGQQGSSPDLGGYGATASSNTVVLQDGIRMNPIDQQSAPLNTIPLAAIERIEIVNGGASVQFGNNATGGVINIITKGGPQQSSYVGLNYGSYGTVIGDVSLRRKENNTMLMVSANSSKTNGWRENSDALSESFLGRITQTLGGVDQIFIDASANHSQGKMPQIIEAEVGKSDVYFIKPANIGNNYIQDGSNLRAGIVKGISQNTLFEMEASYGSNSSISQVQGTLALFDKSSLNLTPRLKFNWGKWGSSIIGYDFNISDGSNTQNYQQPNPATHVNLNNQSLYFMNRLPVTDQVELIGGIRRQKQDITLVSFGGNFDKNNMQIADGTYQTSFAANAYDLGVNYMYSSGQRLYTKYNQSYRFANTDEYFGFNPATQQNFSTGAVLRPQINKTVEIGGDFTYGQSKLNVGIFQTDSHDEIRLFNNSDTQTQNNINDADIRRTGANLNGTTKASSNLNLGAGLRYQRAIYTSGTNTGYLVSLVPQYLFNLNTRYQVTSQIAVSGVLNYVASQYYDGDLQNAFNQMPSYVFGDVSAEYRVKSWEARFTIKNVSNVNYAVYGSNNSYSGNSAYNYLPAPPRTFWVSLRYNFDL